MTRLADPVRRSAFTADFKGASFYWPSMGKDADQVQTQCGTCQLAADREESYAVFISEDWRSPFIQYLTEGILPQKHSERY